MNKFANMLAKSSININGQAEIIAAFAVVGIVFMMILPLPNALIDVLIALNICISFLLVMLSMYFPSPLYFSTFPAVLLFTTLFRLALSISTTRSILLEADAGNIVQAFGSFVVGGNLAVGIVIFLILTLVQFLVITKGSERVAEVSARFTLDAMPGKQMSIDSDLRAGLISPIDAKNKRNDLARTNQLFGAMDGAMKFVKGDAIAGIIIVLVNLIGGASIGVAQFGLTAAESMELYSILTIGDGLVAQIPALLIALTAGMIITRVTDDDATDVNVGRDIAAQLASQPRAWVIAGVVMAGFAMIPGMPTFTFLVFSAATLSVGFVSILRERRDIRTGMAESQDMEHSQPMSAEESMYNEDIRTFKITRDYLLLMHPSIKDTPYANELVKLARQSRNEIVLNYGFTLPNLFIDYVPNIEKYEYRFCVSEVPVAKGIISPNLVCVQMQDEEFDKLKIESKFKNKDALGSQLIWVEEKHIQMLKEKRVPFGNFLTAAEINVRQVYQRTGPRFIGIQETQKLLEWLERELPELCKELQRVVPTSMMAEVLQRLAIEGISIRDLRVIAEALVENGQTERDVGMLTDYVRVALKDQICHAFAQHDTLNAILMSPESEETLRNSVRQTTKGGFLALDPDATKNILEKIEELQKKCLTEGMHPMLLVAQDIRRFVFNLIKDEKFSIPVLSYAEVTATTRVKPVECIDL